MDAMRIMPVLGAFLWMVPLLWSEGEAAGPAATNLSVAIKYVFGVWFGVIVVSALLWLMAKETVVPDTSADRTR